MARIIASPTGSAGGAVFSRSQFKRHNTSAPGAIAIRMAISLRKPASISTIKRNVVPRKMAVTTRMRFDIALRLGTGPASVQVEGVPLQRRKRRELQHVLVRRLEDDARRLARLPGLDPP